MAHLHGRPWKPWQRTAADIAGELLPNGRYAYPIVVVLVPRQCGKTTWMFDLAMGRALRYGDYLAAYCAQTGHVTSERFTERMDSIPAPIARHVTTRRSGGTERIRLPRGSYLKAFPPKDGALRGSALDLVLVDEPQEHDEALGRALDRTILPTFQTRPRRQLILAGTAGTARSAYLRRYLDKAQAGEQGVAIVEYGAPAGFDIDDEASWQDFHPGLASGLTDLEALRQARAGMDDDAGWLREYANIWTVGQALSPIAATTWATRAVETFVIRPGGVALAFDVAPDRSEAAIGAALRTPDGLTHVRLLETRPGDAWLADRLVALSDQLRAPIAYDAYGPGIDVAQELERRKPRAGLRSYSLNDYAAACIGLAADVRAGLVTHAGQAPLDLSVAGSERRRIGDRWIWARDTATSAAPVVSVTLARHAALSTPPRRKPVAQA